MASASVRPEIPQPSFPPGPRPRKQTFAFALILTAVLVTLAVGLYVRGREFYALEIGDRVDHPDFRILGPGEIVGHGYGIAGTLLIVTNLIYLARRKLAAWRLGSMRTWLDIHVITGLSGSLLVAFHSAFQLRTPIAVSTMIALGIVVVTGIIGRWIFTLTPRPDYGRMESHLLAFDLVDGMGQAIRRELARIPTTELTRVSLVRALLMVPRWMKEARLRRAAVFEVARPYEAKHLAEVRLLHSRLVECANIAAAQTRYVAATTMMRSWRGMHRLAAILMLLFVSVHIVVAWMMGYRWIFSE